MSLLQELDLCNSFKLGTVVFYGQTQMLVILFVSPYNDFYGLLKAAIVWMCFVEII